MYLYIYIYINTFNSPYNSSKHQILATTSKKKIPVKKLYNMRLCLGCITVQKVHIVINKQASSAIRIHRNGNYMNKKEM